MLCFEWDVVELIFVYLSEIVVVAVLFAIVALVAAQPVEDHDADKWREDPSPVQPVPLLPPIYPRNVGLILNNMFAYAVFFSFFVAMFVSVVDRSVSSLLSPTASLVILAICVTQLRRVWVSSSSITRIGTDRQRRPSNSALVRSPGLPSSPCT
ncbi:hypothetical protein [Haloplanus pelagicus]|uniref:hypothetical protein n=1 Tax=Haloplanus pelagicus TaxID=2949995 RepID=UPI003CE51CC0